MSDRRDKENEKSNKQLWHYKQLWRQRKIIFNHLCDNFNPKRSNQVRTKEMKPETRTKSIPEGSPTAEKEVKKENVPVECVVLNDGFFCLEVNSAFLKSSSSLVCLVDIYCSLNLRCSDFVLIRSSGNYSEDEERIGQRVVNFLLQSALTDKNSLARLEQFMSNLLHVIEDVATGSILEEARTFLKTILELIDDMRNAAKNDYFRENFNIIALAKENDRRDSAIFSQLKHMFNNDRLMMFYSVQGKKFGSVMDEEKSTPAVFSTAGTSSGEPVGHFRSMLLKMLKRGPQEMLESFQSEATEHSGGGGKRIRLSKVTRAMRARMRNKTEKERAKWEKSSDDEYK